MVVAAYRTPSMKTRDARVLDFISTILSDGKSSRLYKNIVDDKKMALQIGAIITAKKTTVLIFYTDYHKHLLHLKTS
jgi:predicted Zn-dependent peptidase